jgi:hypothetical protein
MVLSFPTQPCVSILWAIGKDHVPPAADAADAAEASAVAVGADTEGTFFFFRVPSYEATFIELSHINFPSGVR